MTKKERLAIAKDICARVEKVIAGAKTVKNFNIKSTRKILDIVDMVVSTVENYSVNIVEMSGEDKKKLATEVLNQMINIKLKFVPRKLMDKVEGIIIGFVIEFAVGFLNKKLGKAWLQG